MRRPLLRTAVVLTAVLGLTGCWLQPGFDAERSGFNPLDGSVTPANVGGLHRVWTVRLGPGVNDPAVSAHGVYVTTGGYPQEAKLTLLTRADGTARWTVVLFSAQDPHTVGSPTLVGGAVDVPVPGISNIVGDSIQVFDAATGHARPPIAERTFEVIGRDANLVGTQGECTDTLLCLTSLFVYNPVRSATWSTNLDVTTGGLSAVTSPAVGPHRIFIGRNGNVQSWPLTPPTNCTEMNGLRLCPPSWSTPTAAAVAGHPVVSADDATVFAAAGTRVTALDASNGKPTWTGTLDATASAAPAVSTDFIYVPTTNGDLQVFATNGCGKSTCTPLWTGHTHSSITRQPAATSGGLVYTVSADGTVHAYPAAGCGGSTCTSRWSAATGGTITGGPVPALGNLYIGTSDGRLIAYST
jgi:hypothetical protein